MRTLSIVLLSGFAGYWFSQIIGIGADMLPANLQVPMVGATILTACWYLLPRTRRLHQESILRRLWNDTQAIQFCIRQQGYSDELKHAEVEILRCFNDRLQRYGARWGQEATRRLIDRLDA